MNKAIKLLAVGLVLVRIMTSCTITQTLSTPVVNEEVLTCSAVPENRYDGLTYGLVLNVSSDVTNEQIYDASELTSKQFAKKEVCTFTPSIREFTDESMSTYIRSMGISLGQVESSYFLNVKVREFKLVASASQMRATVILDYTLSNYDNEVVLRQTARGRYLGGSEQGASSALDKAYSKALADMDWNSIANALRVNRRADQEPQKKVQGNGDTALEQTVIRWYVTSSPQGADVSWRIISSTPDVKNTNTLFVGSTPYETTETFDIRGLKLDNAGNVQVEVTCEKLGYITQKKRFNLRQVIEQKEISTKFNLVKEDE